jgi:small subunit ribosomal protein S1
MTEEIKDDPENGEGEEESFADLLAAYDTGMNEDIQVGDQIQGRIISIGGDTVYLDTGSKIDGVVDKVELLDENGEMPLAVGDTLDLFVVAQSESEIRLSRAMSGIGGLHMLQDAYANRVPVEGRVKETCKGGFSIEVLQRRAFCPISQIDLKYVETPDDYVGQTLSFRITRLEENGRNIVVSRKQLLAEAQEESRREFFASLKEGDTLSGTVTRVMPYGAFVALSPGVEGMVHISELSWSRVEHTDQAVAEGDALTVKVLGIDDGKKPGQKKISLSVKQVSGDPWDLAEQQFEAGQKVTGTVRRLMGFGAFVEIAPGIEGLVHISEMSYTRRILKPEDVVSVGESVSVMIQSVDGAARRISLSIKDAEGDPWLEVGEKFKVGQRLDGTVEKKEGFGLFVNLAPGITGLLPKSKMAQSADPARIEASRPGQTVQVLIEEIHPNRRKITLGPGDAEDNGDWESFAPETETPMGTLAEKLQAALRNKK